MKEMPVDKYVLYLTTILFIYISPAKQNNCLQNLQLFKSLDCEHLSSWFAYLNLHKPLVDQSIDYCQAISVSLSEIQSNIVELAAGYSYCQPYLCK